MSVQLNQAFPIYYTAEARPFQLNGQNSGAVGASARLSHTFNNSPHRIMGVRMCNTFDLPTDTQGGPPTADQMALWMLCREINDDQEVRLELSQQSVFAQFVNQKALCGKNGEIWHPFATPFVVAGGNDFKLEVRRIIGFPSIGGHPVLPYVSATLICEMLVNSGAEPPVMRRG